MNIDDKVYFIESFIAHYGDVVEIIDELVKISITSSECDLYTPGNIVMVNKNSVWLITE